MGAYLVKPKPELAWMRRLRIGIKKDSISGDSMDSHRLRRAREHDTLCEKNCKGRAQNEDRTRGKRQSYQEAHPATRRLCCRGAMPQ